MLNAVCENLSRDDSCAAITRGSILEGRGVGGINFYMAKDSENEIFDFKFSKTCFNRKQRKYSLNKRGSA